MELKEVSAALNFCNLMLNNAYKTRNKISEILHTTNLHTSPQILKFTLKHKNQIKTQLKMFIKYNKTCGNHI